MKDKTYFLVFLIGCILLILGIIITIILIFEEEKKKEDWNQYDSYLFSIFWPASSCFNKLSENETCFNKVRELGIDNYFIIHGLWPTYKNGKLIDQCNKNEEINVTFTDEEYRKELVYIWPGLYSSEQNLWNQEYNKHGYCYVQRKKNDPKKDYKSYFDKTKEIFNDDYHGLMEHIIPDIPKGLHNIKKVKFKEILSESTLRLAPSMYSLICNINDTQKTNVLYEIRFNYDLDMKRINDIASGENCPDVFQIYYSNETKKPLNETYNYYVFSLTWNPTKCKIYGKECYKKLKKKELNILMLNGLWPSLHDGIPLQWCNFGEDVQVDSFSGDLNISMTNYWIATNTLDNVLWTYDYNKHGYCYSQKNDYNVENYSNYFQKAVDLYEQYNVKNLLIEMFPDHIYGVQKLNKTYMVEKLNEILGIGKYTLTCFKYSKDIYYLSEVRLKLNLTFDLTNESCTEDNCTETIYAEFLEDADPHEEDKEFYKNYDIYFFTISWLPTLCRTKSAACYERIELLPKNLFTVHGLWPNYKNGTLPKWCNGKNDIEIEIKDDNLLEFMNNYYPGSFHTNEYLWGHEYNKHGFCYNKRNGYDTNKYEIYFKKIKDMYEQYNFGNIFIDLYKDRIKPGDMEINRTEVQEFLEERGFAKDVYLLVCTNISENYTEVNPHLLEIRIRFDINFTVLENATDVSEFDCPEKFYAEFL
jgi:ribonuclease I